MLTAHSATLLTAVRMPSGAIDLPATIAAAAEACALLAKADADYTASLGRAAREAWQDPHFSGVKSIALSALVRMALARLSILPDEKNYKDAVIRLRSVIATSSVFIMPKSGSVNGNVYLRAKMTEQEIEKAMK